MPVLDYFDLTNKTVVVTQSTSNIGRLVTYGFMQCDAKVAMASAEGGLETIARELHLRTDSELLALPLDAADEQQAHKIFSLAQARLGQIHVAVCCGEFAPITMGEDASRVPQFVASGLRTAVLAAAAALIRQGTGGVIIVSAMLQAYAAGVSRFDAEALHGELLASLLPVVAQYSPYGIRINFIWWFGPQPLSEIATSGRSAVLSMLSSHRENTHSAMALFIFLASDAAGLLAGVDFKLHADGTLFAAQQCHLRQPERSELS